MQKNPLNFIIFYIYILLVSRMGNGTAWPAESTLAALGG